MVFLFCGHTQIKCVHQFTDWTVFRFQRDVWLCTSWDKAKEENNKIITGKGRSESKVVVRSSAAQTTTTNNLFSSNPSLAR